MLSYVLAFAIGYIAYLRVGISLEAVVMTIYAWFLLAVAIIDLEHRLVLNRMLIGALPVVAAVILLLGMPSPAKALLGGLIGFGVFLLLALLRPGGMGMGDVKLAGLIGLAIGVTGVAISLVVGIVAAGVAGAVLMVLHRFDRRASMAYAPYLALGAWIAMYYLAPAIPSTPL